MFKPRLPVFRLSLERIQGGYYLEEPEESEYITSPWRRHGRSAFLFRVAINGIRELERVPRAFSGCLEVEVGKADPDARL